MFNTGWILSSKMEKKMLFSNAVDTVQYSRLHFLTPYDDPAMHAWPGIGTRSKKEEFPVMATPKRNAMGFLQSYPPLEYFPLTFRWKGSAFGLESAAHILSVSVKFLWLWVAWLLWLLTHCCSSSQCNMCIHGTHQNKHRELPCPISCLILFNLWQLCPMDHSWMCIR